MWPSSFTYFICSFDVNTLDIIPLLIRHRLETFIAKDTRIVDNDVDSAECVKTGFNDCFTVFYGMTIADGFSSCSFDFFDCFIGIADIVDNDTGTEFGE